MNLLIKPSSYHCNLDCTYCFYKRVEEVYPEKRAMMSIETASSLIEKSLSRGETGNSFCWQGGEPTLLGLDFYKEIVEIQKRYILQGQSIENSLQTNGLLLDDEWCVFLKGNNFLIGLSLDGPEDVHDRYRRFSSGEGTFDRVMGSIELLKKHKVKFNILTLLTDANVHSPEKLYQFYHDNDLNYLQFIPCIEFDQFSELLSFSINGRELGEFYCRLFDLWMEDGFPYISIRLFEDIFIYMIDGVHASCGWLEECGSYLLIEHNGDCYPCDFFVYPEWKLGNIVEESFDSIMRNRLREDFGRMKSDIPDECRNCRWLGFCNGDCTKFRFSENGKFNNLSNLCVTWKKLLEHIEPHLENIKERVLKIRSAIQENVFEKTGRNDPCPCGSGEKFKKCCGRGIMNIDV